MPTQNNDEIKIPGMVDIEVLKAARKKHEEETIKGLGDLPYAQMLDFVEENLAQVSSTTEDMAFKRELDYSRFEHTKRVLGWAKRLYDLSPVKDELRYEDVIIATIFHDVGRNEGERLNIPHAKAGVPITRDYLISHGYGEERAEYISGLVGAHSDKWRMKEPDIDKNLVLLMEADLLDDMGALGVVMDCMITKGRNPKARFDDCLDHITRFTLRIQQDNPMVTPEGREIWDRKTALVESFVKALKEDIEL